ncbi:MAG: Gfo/Idh/MocA family oxidoreductase [Proteobacteria bacterium]|nr:Gfo/Idh/MocA family oxidoreductase [Pseudomonadota bacterium]
MAGPIPIAIVGVGKIARDQHLPAIAANPDFLLAAAISRQGKVEGVPNFTDFESFLRDGPVAAVALCTPPDVRVAMCLAAIEAGRDLLIEKPPAATLGEIETIIAAAKARGVTLFTTWHSRFAPAVERARIWIAARNVTRLDIIWREDVRRWHPGQAWIWLPGGFGVFDPGINALSILTHILPGPIHVEAAELDVPSNAFTAIAARLAMRARGTIPLTADFDWRQEGPQTWSIVVEAGSERMELLMGGAELLIDGRRLDVGPEQEYPAIYRRFARLVSARESDTDISPLRIVADACLKGRQVATDAFRD